MFLITRFRFSAIVQSYIRSRLLVLNIFAPRAGPGAPKIQPAGEPESSPWGFRASIASIRPSAKMGAADSSASEIRTSQALRFSKGS